MKIKVPAEVMDRYHDTITRSMAFLDDYLGGPEWVNKIDLEALDLEDSTMCVCGQLFDAETGTRTIEDMEDEDGYGYALKHVVEHGVPEEVRSQYRPQEEEDGVHLYRVRMAQYLGFTTDEEDFDEMVARGNGYTDTEAMWDDEDLTPSDIPGAWSTLTKTWRERIEKRRAELGTMA